VKHQRPRLESFWWDAGKIPRLQRPLRFGLLADIIAVSLKSDVSANGPAFNGGSAKLTEFIATVMATYRALEFRNQFLDIGVGVRPVAYWTAFTFNSGALPGFSRSPSVSWADPLLGARYHLDLSKRFGLTAYGDVGGFGAGSNLTWQLLGTVDYRFNQWLVMHAGLPPPAHRLSRRRAARGYGAEWSADRGDDTVLS
jgi:hypothetical protein